MQSTSAICTYLSSARILSTAVPTARKRLSVVWRQWQAARIWSIVVLLRSLVAQIGPLSGALGPARWTQRGPVRDGPFGCFSLRGSLPP